MPGRLLSSFRFRAGVLDWSRPYVAGVLNVTPDSFSDGGRYPDVAAAVAAGVQLWRDGADVVDVGGESTRPGAARVDVADELERVVPVIRGLCAAGVRAPISIDTVKPEVAAAACAAGAEIVNDVSGGLFDPRIVDAVADAGAAYVCSHVRAGSANLDAVHASEDQPPAFDAVVAELRDRIAALPAALRRRTIADPGIGFGKRGRENLPLLARAGELAAAVGCPVMVGPSRKRFLGELTGAPVGDRDDATIGAGLAAVAGGAHIVRVHAVRGFARALAVYRAVVASAGASAGAGGRAG